jgi:mycofactocin precursor
LAANKSIATLLRWSQVVERRLPARCSEFGRVTTTPFHFGTRCHILAISITFVEIPWKERWISMESNQQVEAETELVAETLVEEVSIDGMCGVY